MTPVPRRGILAATKVGEVLKRLRAGGRKRVMAQDRHRQFKHPTKRGRVTVSGKLSHTLPPGTLASIFKQAGWAD